METCRKCNTEIENGKGRFRTEEGIICLDCVKKLGKLEWRREDAQAKEYASSLAKKALHEAEEQAYREAQTAIGRVLFPLSGPRRELSRGTLKKIIAALKIKDVDERALRINNLIKAASPKIEAATREARKAKTNTDDTRDDAGLAIVQGGQG
ncbi:MAG: hypothetical protein A4E60_01690 [Syntrophorhabdus sp. PtaB.Bin047]|jgi:hypothetical protein|nr:MAG: hypothetical protein A4E60_01690 [Syntrophorhabdus sp. PtaB.Bin047]